MVKMTAEINRWREGQYAKVRFTDPTGEEWEVLVYDSGKVYYSPVAWTSHLPNLPKSVELKKEDF
jgi:hypothetical protein